MKNFLHLLLMLMLVIQLIDASKIFLDQNGGYKRIVVRIDDELNEENCHHTIQSLKVRLR